MCTHFVHIIDLLVMHIRRIDVESEEEDVAPRGSGPPDPKPQTLNPEP